MKSKEAIQQAEVSISDFTELIREADRLFEKVGGSTRHFVRDCLLPLMEEKGMKLIFTDCAEWMAGEADRLRPQKMGIGKLRALIHAFDSEQISMSKFLEEINLHFMPLPPKPSDHA
jgi:hypothetical protein